MKTMNGAQIVKRLKSLPDMGELVVDGTVWTKFSNSKEFKVSPKGLQDDFDTDCSWVDYSDLSGEFSDEKKTYQVGRK